PLRTPSARATPTDPRACPSSQSGHNASVTSTTAGPASETSRVHPLTPPHRASVGPIVWLSSELVFFAGLFAMYFTVRSVHAGDWPMAPVHLDIPYALVFTLILVASSI